MTTDARSIAARAMKSQIRNQVRSRILELPPAFRAQADRAICGQLLVLAGEEHATVVLGYLALTDEVRIDPFLTASMEAGRRVFLPRIEKGRIEIGEWRPGSPLRPDEKGVLAPDRVSVLPQGGKIMVVVPGRAFDFTGGRLGRGAGYYDRLLSGLDRTVLFVGAAYDCQLVEEVPREIHDRDVDVLVTECRTRRAGREESHAGSHRT